MNFEEARAEFAKISGGRYRSMNYELTETPHTGFENAVRCSLYVDPGIRTAQYSSWELALADLKDRLNPQAPDPTQYPVNK